MFCVNIAGLETRRRKTEENVARRDILFYRWARTIKGANEAIARHVIYVF